MEAIKCSNCGEILRAGTITCPDCGTAIRVPVETRPLFRRFNWSAATVALGGALIILGSCLTWETWVDSFQPGELVSGSETGLEGGDGVVSVLIGVVIVLLGILYLRRPGLPGGRVGVFALGWVSIVATLYEGSILQSQLDNTRQVVGHLGIGLYVIGAGGAIVAVISVLGQHKPFRRDLYEPLEQPEQ
jgi:hypothetical protein